MAAPAMQFQTAHDEAVSIEEACRRLAGIHRATFYRIPFFRTRRIRLSDGRVGVLLADIDQYLRLQRGR